MGVAKLGEVQAIRNKSISQIDTLIIAAQNGDKDAMGELYIRTKKFCDCRVAVFFSNYHAAQDVVSNIWLTVIRKLHLLQTPRAYFSWLKRLCYTCAINYNDRHKQLTYIGSFDVADYRQRPPVDFDQYNALAEAIAGLGKISRMTIRDFYYRGLSIKQIAAKRKIPIGTAKRRLHTARAQLRKMLAAEEVY